MSHGKSIFECDSESDSSRPSATDTSPSRPTPRYRLPFNVDWDVTGAHSDADVPALSIPDTPSIVRMWSALDFHVYCPQTMSVPL